MKYLIKSLKWTKHYKKETWWGPNSNGYSHYIINAGIYTEADRMNMGEDKTRAFILLTQKLINKGIKQLNYDIKLYESEIQQYNKQIKASEARISTIKTKINDLARWLD